jgi:streptogramin lyase
VSEFTLPPATTCASGGTHVSGIGLQGGGSLVWFDDSLDAQVGSFNPASKQFSIDTLVNCGAHPHDGLALDQATPPHVWWTEEFANALGRLTQ